METDDVSVDELDTLTSDARTLQNDVATDVRSWQRSRERAARDLPTGGIRTAG